MVVHDGGSEHPTSASLVLRSPGPRENAQNRLRSAHPGANPVHRPKSPARPCSLIGVLESARKANGSNGSDVKTP